MSQTSYSQTMTVGRAGMIADNGPRDVVSKTNPVVALKFGRAVCRGTADRDVKLPTSAAEAAACIGVTLLSQSIESSATGDPQYPVGSDVPVLKKGRVWVQVTEAVVAGSPVYVRYATGLADTGDVDKGGFSDTGDGTAQVSTLTPTAVNATRYTVNLSGKTLAGAAYSEVFTYDSDADATAAEIVAGLLALINASTVPVTASGTSTLILTADTAGVPFTVDADPNLSVAATTANAATAERLLGAEFVTSASADGLAVVEFNLV